MAVNFYRIIFVRIIMRLLSEPERDYIFDEVNYWWKILNKPCNEIEERRLEKLLLEKKEYRNLFVYRLRHMNYNLAAKIIVRLFRPLDTLFLSTEKIGPRLFIQHGFSTYIAAKEIGSDCWINQQVTIGYDVDNPEPPRIGNGVRITAGAKVIGNVSVGDNAIVAANAVVVRDVMENDVVGGVPAKIISTNHTHRLYYVE